MKHWHPDCLSQNIGFKNFGKHIVLLCSQLTSIHDINTSSPSLWSFSFLNHIEGFTATETLNTSYRTNSVSLVAAKLSHNSLCVCSHSALICTSKPGTLIKWCLMFSVLRRLCGESLFIGLPSVRSKVSQASLAPDFRTQVFCSTGALIQQTTKSSYSLCLRCVGSCSWSSLNDHMKIFRCDESSGFICSYFGWLPLLPKKCIKKLIFLKLTYARI